ncbi:unnamed protein product [Vitrella brassicaformis CCMP3155]|uniref:Uncharacterized protein n=2 Tax=Vitrella brassicaformis TaxID=1169539 RepID=A0A0G4EVN7_VITBC|nr:unnamed protein product [Vitrella brassicaformis CCMP3155]|eukprot:CEM02156.1 unnamed protein product [Vitrella brassicaformis CCMP3155]
MAESSSSSAGPALPRHWESIEAVNAVFRHGTIEATKRLCVGIFLRAFTDARQVADLIRVDGAGPTVMPALRLRGYPAGSEEFPCLALAIDNLTDYGIPSIWASDSRGPHPVALPKWRTPELQDDIICALLEGGADINGEAADDLNGRRPIRVAIASCNERAFRLLIERGVQLRGRMVMRLPRLDSKDSPTKEHEATLMSFYRQLIQRDPTLATDRVVSGDTPSVFSQEFFDSHMDLIVSNGADVMRAGVSSTPLLNAPLLGCNRAAAALCRHLTAAQVNRGGPHSPNRTPLMVAAEQLDRGAVLVEGGLADEDETARWRVGRIQHDILTINVLLRAGADITRLPTATQQDRRRHQRVLAEYKKVLNELGDVVVAAINAALAPQRDHSMTLARLLPLAPHHDGARPHPTPSNLSFGPHEAEGIGWKIGAFLHEPSAAVATIDEYLMGESLLRRRVHAAVLHSVSQGATRTSSNRKVVGGTQYVQQEGGAKRTKVTVPPLQCFAANGGQQGGGQHRLLGVREVVHRARLDEATQHGLQGVEKGFNADLGNSDCQFQWQQLGYVDSNGEFISLAAAFQTPPAAAPAASDHGDGEDGEGEASDSSGDDLDDDEGDEFDDGEGWEESNWDDFDEEFSDDYDEMDD